MYLLIEIRDGTKPENVSEATFVDLIPHATIESAIIDAEPHNMDEERFLVVDEYGNFGKIVKADHPYLPELSTIRKDQKLGKIYFDRYRKINH